MVRVAALCLAVVVAGVLGSVSMYWSDVERSKRKLEISLFILIVVLVLIAYAGLLIHNGLETGVKDLLAKYF